MKTIIALLLFGLTTQCQANLKVFTEPNGPYRIINLINHATNSINIEIYLMTNRKILHALTTANKRGAKIKLIVEKRPYGSASNNYAKYYLMRAGIPKWQIHWGNPRFTYTHEKAIIIDANTTHAKALILTFNLTNAAFYRNREYGIVDTNKKDVREIMQLFNNDWHHTNPQLKQKYNLVWSPINSRKKLITLINSARKSLLIEGEELNDPQLKHALNKQAKRGVKIAIVL